VIPAAARCCRPGEFEGRQPHIIPVNQGVSKPACSAARASLEAPQQRGGSDAAAAAARIGVTRLMLTDFRNYRRTSLALGTDPVVLTGANGAGKTNLLEAVSLLAPGRGLRRARLTEIERWRIPGEAELPGSPIAGGWAVTGGWAVAAELALRHGTLRVGTGHAGTGRDGATGERRVVHIDGERVPSQAALGEAFGIVWLTPAMDRLFLDGPGARRRFLDRLVLALDPGHAARVAAYEQALRERSQLLRAGISSHRPADPAWLAALEAMMAAQGVAVAAARCDAVERLDAICAAAEGPFPRARLRLAGTIEAWLDEMPALAAEARFAEALAAARHGDAISGGAELGPHRCDLAVRLAPAGIAAEHSSTGEQKALLIAILLAHAALQRTLRGEPPILLLDEVAAHLDAARRDALFDAIARLASQAWLTGTDPAAFAPLRHRAQFWSVRGGALAPASI